MMAARFLAFTVTNAVVINLAPAFLFVCRVGYFSNHRLFQSPAFPIIDFSNHPQICPLN